MVLRTKLECGKEVRNEAQINIRRFSGAGLLFLVTGNEFWLRCQQRIIAHAGWLESGINNRRWHGNLR